MIVVPEDVVYLRCNKVVESLKYRWLIKYSQVGFTPPVSRAMAILKVRVRFILTLILINLNQ